MSTRRLAGIFGLAYIVGVAIENMEVLGSPTLSSSVEAIRHSYADKALGVVSSFAGVCALVAYVAFVATLCAWLRERERRPEPWSTIALLGGVAGPTVAAVGLSASAILVARSGAGLGDDTVRALYDVYLLCRIVSGIFVALFLGGIGVAAVRTRALPSPLPQLALVIGLPLALAPLAAFDQVGGLELAVAISFAAQAFWIFLASMWLVLPDGLSPLEFLRRAAFLVLIIAAGLIGIALLAAPAASGTFFAWVLRPEPLAAFAGGVYVGSAAAYALALPRSAREVRGPVLGAVVLSVSVFIVTLGHTDKFDFSRLQAIMWVILFAAFSVLTTVLLLFDPGEAAGVGRRLPRWARVVFAAVAAGGAALAAALWIHPGGLSGASPFKLSALGGGFAGSWVAMLATVCAWAALRNRTDEARPAAYMLACVPAGALVAGLRTIDELHPATAYLAILALLVTVGIAALAGTARSVDGTTNGGR
ncbi:MAG: hypothetical protein JO243_12075 [Solirubrobacterales bacterium]|nr:hypothetical protein [Solirubrobacterales bacterium]